MSEVDSVWATISESVDLLARLEAERGWKSIERSAVEAWTDDYSNVIQLFKW